LRITAQELNQMTGRQPRPSDIEAWELIYEIGESKIDPENEMEWDTLARGFLLGRGVANQLISAKLLIAMSIGDYSTMLESLDVVDDDETE